MRPTVYRVYSGLTSLLALAVVVQVFLAGVGVFGVDSTDLDKASSFDPHRALGNVIGGLALVILLAAVIARAPARAVWGSIVLFLLAGFAQTGLAAAGDDNKWVGGLHAADGVVILLLALWLHLDSRAGLRRSAPAPPSDLTAREG
jgi:cytochrome b561